MSRKRTDASANKESSASTLRQRTDSWPIRSQALVSVWSSPQDLSDFLSSAESKTWKLDILYMRKRKSALGVSSCVRPSLSGEPCLVWCSTVGSTVDEFVRVLGDLLIVGQIVNGQRHPAAAKKRKKKSNQFPRGKFLRLWVWKTTIILFLLSSKWKVSTWLVSLQYFDGEGACGIKLLTFQLYYPSTRWYTLRSTNVTFVEFFLCTFTTDNTTVHRTALLCEQSSTYCRRRYRMCTGTWLLQ